MGYEDGYYSTVNVTASTVQSKTGRKELNERKIVCEKENQRERKKAKRTERERERERQSKRCEHESLSMVFPVMS